MDNDKKIKNTNNNNKIDSELNRKISQVTDTQIRIKTSNKHSTEGKTLTNYKALAAGLNTFGKWSFAGGVLLFNVGFWGYSLCQYWG